MRGTRPNAGVKMPARVPTFIPARQHGMPQHLAATVRNLKNVLIYVWLKNGRGFWFFLLRVEQGQLGGYIRVGQKWQFQRIPLGHMWSYY